MFYSLPFCPPLNPYLQVEKEDISFLREAAPVKIESKFDLHAFDSEGNKILFKIKAHVSFNSNLKCSINNQI